ncbi:MAG TPA: hypothetical protein VE288_12700 [Rubrobacteraceae bacterium]|nr:hypothetical protein [Rubrobacteraceae bacterium]
MRCRGPEFTAGPYDIVLILEAPDEESVTAFLLDVGSWSGQNHHA